MYKIGDVVVILNGKVLINVIIVKINLNGMLEVMTDTGEKLVIYRCDIIE